MAANLQLTELEQRVLHNIKSIPGQHVGEICWTFTLALTGYTAIERKAEVRQAIGRLVSFSFISADDLMRYHAVGGEL